MPAPTNGLARILAQRIVASGPISVAEFMAEALGHPEYGYYMAKDPLGGAGDFITAPEISQMFGELVGLWCANAWLALGKPTPFILAELGPGRGTLMADVLRALATVPACRAAARVHLIERSPVLRERQKETLSGLDVTWHNNVNDLPMLPAVFVANEFFDALPIEQFVCRDDGWRRRLVDLAPASADGAPEFAFIEAPAPAPAGTLPPAAAQTAEIGAIAETSPAAQQIAVEMARRIRSHTGAALIIDYGYRGPAVGDTLQAVRQHDYTPVLERPGAADLTAHVDFTALAAAARSGGAAAWGPVPQGAFLRRLGIETRAVALAAAATSRQQADIASALNRLIGDAQMGTLFQVVAIAPPASAPPAGFLPEDANLD